METLWLETTEDTGFGALPDGGVDVEVAIIGGGMAGLTAAFLLKEAGRRVAVVESKRIVHGETGHTTAHLTALQDRPFHTIARKFGKEGARRIAQAGMEAIAQVEFNVRTLGIDCDFERVPAYVYTQTVKGIRALERESHAAREAGLDCRLVDEVPLPFPVAKALRFEDQAKFHPRKYLLPLAARIDGGGSFIFENTHVLDVKEGSPCRIRTARGELRAAKVIGATDAVILNRVLMQTRLAPYRTYVVGLRVEHELPGLFYDTADPYHYVRTHHDEAGPVLIVGGEDHRVGEREDTERCYEALEKWTRERFGAGEVVYRWSGQVQEPVDGLPFVGRNAFSTRVFVATGFSGNGMVNGTLAGMVLSDLVMERENPYARLLSATRIKPFASAVSYVTENADFPMHLVTDRLPARHRSLESVEPGQGALVAHGGRKLAVFRDEAGGLHAFSAVCTHLGCHVHWNPEAKSWDCPCHGSRFDAQGEVLHGPATRALSRVNLEEEAEAPAHEPEPEQPGA